MESNVVGVNADDRKHPILQQTPLKYQLQQMQMQGSLNVVDIHLNDLLTGGPHLDGQIYSIVMLMRGLDLHQIEFAEILAADVVIGFGF